jgi:hypothetical protein
MPYLCAYVRVPVADELFQGFAEAAGVAGQPLAEELQHLSQLGSVGWRPVSSGAWGYRPSWLRRA